MLRFGSKAVTRPLCERRLGAIIELTLAACWRCQELRAGQPGQALSGGEHDARAARKLPVSDMSFTIVEWLRVKNTSILSD